MNAFLALVRKDLRLYFSNKRALIITLAAPIAIAAFFGSLFGGGDKKPSRVPIAVVDQDVTASDDAGRKGLSEEAIWLARALVSVAPGDAEPRGLLALMLFCEARAKARRADLRYVPLADQQVDLWDREMIAAAERATDLSKG